MNKLIQLRKRMKKKKPVFLRQDAHKKKRLGTGWRRPKGMHSKIRLHHLDKRRRPEPGFGSPLAVKGLSKEGLEKIIVANVEQLEGINKEKQGVIIGSTVGNKKRLMIIRKATELKIQVLNFKNAEKYADNIEAEMKKKSEKKKEKEHLKEKKKHEKEKKADKKEETKLEQTVAEEENKEKKEMDKVLIKAE
jgi:large subunit ribosomal protein L32e